MSSIDLATQSSTTHRRILVVEDDEAFRDTICNVLEMSEQYQVRFAENGLVAKTILDLNAEVFDLVISDIKMPEMDGLALLSYSKAAHPKTKFIIITGFSEALESRDAYSMGADEFIAKPFRAQELIGLIEKLFAPPVIPAQATQLPVDDEYLYCKIHVVEFTSSSTLPSDIYIRIAENKFIKVAHEGAQIAVSRLQTYREKKVDFFYVRVSEFHKYTGLTVKLAKLVTKSSTVTREQKIKLFRHTTDILMNHIFLASIDPQQVEEAQCILGNTMNVLGNEPDILELMLLMQSHSDAIYSHSLGVATYACLVAKRMGWGSQSTFIKLSMSGLFHDIGMREIPKDIANKSRRLMTAEEIALFETHPTRGRDILASMPDFPSEVIQIVQQHHENCSETGYPFRPPKNKIHPLANIIRVVDEFCDRVLVHGSLNISAPALSIDEMCKYKAEDLDPHAMKALMEVFNYPVPDQYLKLKAA